MSEKKTGGPAFPSTLTHDSFHVPGMALRDYFAAKAMHQLIGVFAGLTSFDSAEEKIETVANKAYQIADAMLKAREE